MKSALFTTLLLASLTLAAPTPSTTSTTSTTLSTSTAEHFTNWAGAIINSPPNGTVFESITARFTVPTIHAPSTTSGVYGGSIWVGLDGVPGITPANSTALLQAGILFASVVTSPVTSPRAGYTAFYEWYPDYEAQMIDATAFLISAGDVMEVTVSATSHTSGIAVIKNLSTRLMVEHEVNAKEGSGTRLVGETAEWIVEDDTKGNFSAPVVSFDPVVFMNCEVTTTAGTKEGPGSGVEIVLGSAGSPYTQANITENTVVVEYVGPTLDD